jgi:hypothetical protein
LTYAIVRLDYHNFMQFAMFPIVWAAQCNVPTTPGEPPQTNGNICDPCRLPGTRAPPPSAPPLPICTWAVNATESTVFSSLAPTISPTVAPTVSPTSPPLVIVQESPSLSTAIIVLCSALGLAFIGLAALLIYKKTKKPIAQDKPKIVVVDPVNLEPGMNYNNFA